MTYCSGEEFAGPDVTCVEGQADSHLEEVRDFRKNTISLYNYSYNSSIDLANDGERDDRPLLVEDAGGHQCGQHQTQGAQDQTACNLIHILT